MDIGKHWRIVADTMHDGLLVVDTGGTIVYANAAAARITGYESGSLSGKVCTILNCTGCEILEEHEPGWCQLFQEGAVQAKKCFITNRQGELVGVVKRASVFKDETGLIVGAVETLTDIRDLTRKEQEIANLRHTADRENGFHGILGVSAPMRRLFHLIENMAKSEAPILIYGESGTGKELVARALHEVSSRRNKPFIKVNCAALNENLLESELFGHVKGAFTGADRTRVGRFEAASGGFILLDEIGDIPLSTQVKLLRVLEELEIERVGDHRPIPVDVRILAATNHDLETLIRQGRFREDLFYRINVVPLYVPPLRDRAEDIPLIARTFVNDVAVRSGKSAPGIAPEAMSALLAYNWPGNVRELLNAIEYAMVLCNNASIELRHLPPKISASQQVSILSALSLDAKSTHEREKLLKILRETRGNQSAAARKLGVSRVTIWNRIKKLGIDMERDVFA